MVPSPDTFGAFVRRTRALRRLTLREFSRETDLDTVRLSQLERHATRKPPYKYEVKAIAQVLNVDLAKLQRLAEDFTPDVKAIESDKHPLRDAVFVCRTEK